jgi:phosphoglycolate phosphatase
MKAYLFDLDGTLTDSREGLYPSFRAGLDAVGIPFVHDDQLAAFLGTPLPVMFRTLRPDVTQRDIETGITAFRLAYERVGVAANTLYPGVVEMLASIRRRGAVSWIVTSKPEFHAERVARHLKLDGYIAGVIGAGLAETDTKTDLVARALTAANVASADAVMVGDRHYDIVGALENNVVPVGVLWGYGTRKELEAAGCRRFVRSADEFRTLFVESEMAFSAKPSLTIAGAR